MTRAPMSEEGRRRIALANAVRARPLIERLMDHVVYDHGCWTWRGALTGKGYGVIGRTPTDPGSRLVHRITYEDLHGRIPDDLEIDHLCRNALCCNPIHLEVTTSGENTKRGMAYQKLSARRGIVKEFCNRGHSLSDDNLKIVNARRGIVRVCKQCDQMRMTKFKQQRGLT